MGKFHKYWVLASAMMINSTLNVSTYFGNVSTYIYSIYYTNRSIDSDYFDIDPSWMFPMYLITTGIGVFLLDSLQWRIGLRLACGCGVLFFTLGMTVTYFMVSYSIWATTLTFMVMVGLGNGVAGACNLMFAAACFESRVGLVSGLVKSTTAISGLLMNSLITSYVNPDNLVPDSAHDKMRYFSQSSVLKRVPIIFLILGSMCAALQGVGLVGLTILKADSISGSRKGRLSDTRQNVESSEDSWGQTQSASSFRSNELDQNKSKMSLFSFDDVKSDRVLLEASYRDKLIMSCENSLTPVQVLKSGAYYVLLSAFIPECMGYIVATNYYKLFGQLWIKDDQFLAFIGSCSSLCVVLFYTACGVLVDRVGIKNTHIVHLSIASVFFSLWYLTAQTNRWLYLAWCLVLYGLHNNQNLLSFLSSMEMFPGPHFATNYGLVQGASIAVYMVGPPLLAFLLSTLGWFSMFFASACFSFFGFMVTVLKMIP